MAGLIAALMSACDKGRCLRNSDCGGGTMCVQGLCAYPPPDGGPDSGCHDVELDAGPRANANWNAAGGCADIVAACTDDVETTVCKDAGPGNCLILTEQICDWQDAGPTTSMDAGGDEEDSGSADAGRRDAARTDSGAESDSGTPPMDGATGKLPPGTACTEGNQCADGFCVDSVCCREACAGGTTDCMACDSTSSLGAGTCGARLTFPSAPSCDDGNDCTAGDVCSEGGLCAGAAGEDGISCTDMCGGTGSCAAGVCTSSEGC